MGTEQSENDSPKKPEQGAVLDNRTSLEIQKLKEEIRHLGSENRQQWLRAAGLVATSLAAIVAFLVYYQQGKQFKSGLVQQRVHFKETLDRQAQQFDKQLEHQTTQLKTTFAEASQVRYLEKAWDLCAAIVNAAGQLRLKASPQNQSTFDELFFVRSAMLPDFQQSLLRRTMSGYRRGPASCRGNEECLGGLQFCVESIACKCQDLVCGSDADAGVARCPRSIGAEECRVNEVKCGKHLAEAAK